jgi:hypothetical protein
MSRQDKFGLLWSVPCPRPRGHEQPRTVLRVAAIALAFLYSSLAVAAERWDISPAIERHDHLSAAWRNWLIHNESPAASTSVNGVELTIRPIRPERGPLKADWWKPGLVHGAAMAVDGAYGEGEQGGLELTLHGLAAGKHSLATFHNWIWRGEPTPLEIRVVGTKVAAKIQPSRQGTDDAEVACAYLEFTTANGQDITVQIEPSGETKDTAPRRIILNGLRLDGPDPNRQAKNPVPAADDEHAAAKPTLAWRPAPDAVAQDVYFGTSLESVTRADRKSPEYRGRFATPRYETDAADPFANYFWRVDEVYNDGGQERVVPGDVWRFAVGRLAFPEAEGYGRLARGGRGGRVIEVTNLNDSGPGSLRAAVEAEGPRTIVFAVSGLITLESRLVLKNPYVTIAGQTAPGKGICIRKYPFGLGGAHDAIVRHVRVRPGAIAGITLDGMGMAGSDHSIIDHCSISWSIDEAFSSRAAHNITLQHTLISEALNDAGHKKYPPGTQHGYAASIGGQIGSFHHNLLAHCAGRNWSLAGGLDAAGRHTGWLDLRNNVVYNWKHRTTDGGAAKVQFVNNYYKPGPATNYLKLLNPERKNVAAFGPQMYFVEGNVLEGRYTADEPLAGVTEPEPYDNFISKQPFFEPHVQTQSANQAYAIVLSDVGCNEPALDEHDARVIDETLRGETHHKGSRTGLPGLPDSEKDVGGWENYPEDRRPDNWDSDHDGMPNWWEQAHRSNPNSPAGDFSESNADSDHDGYTNLEEYLDWMAQPHFDCRADATLDMNLAALCRAFNDDRHFQVGSAAGGAVELRPDSVTARFTPAKDVNGLGAFTMKASDGRGASLIRRIGVRIVP